MGMILQQINTEARLLICTDRNSITLAQAKSQLIVRIVSSDSQCKSCLIWRSSPSPEFNYLLHFWKTRQQLHAIQIALRKCALIWVCRQQRWTSPHVVYYVRTRTHTKVHPSYFLGHSCRDASKPLRLLRTTLTICRCRHRRLNSLHYALTACYHSCQTGLHWHQPYQNFWPNDFHARTHLDLTSLAMFHNGWCKPNFENNSWTLWMTFAYAAGVLHAISRQPQCLPYM